MVDGVVHSLGTTTSLIAVAVLLCAVIPTRDLPSILAAAIYGTGLIAMLWFSAAYHLTTRPEWKEWFRRCDHAAIFAMIAGTYTPFALIAIGGGIGLGLLGLVWVVAIAGMLLKLLRPGDLGNSSAIPYLALGWIGVPLIGILMTTLTTWTLTLLGVGGLLYSAGVPFHLWTSLPYQNAVWHGFVLVAAGCHFFAVLGTLAA